MQSTSSNRITFEAIGTQWDIEFLQETTSVELESLRIAILKRIETFDHTYSRFRDDSLLMQLADAPGRVSLPEDAEPLFGFYQKLFEATDGKVTPLIGTVLSDAGYDAAYSLRPKSIIPSAPLWGVAATYSSPYLEATVPVIVDVGAAGKGYLVDIIGQLLNEKGIYSFTIDASGDILHRSESAAPIRVGLEHPTDPKQIVGVLTIGNESVCSSAVNRRSWRGLHHVMDPDTAAPVQDIVAVWVVAKTAMHADGLATALFFTPALKLQETFDFEFFLIRKDMSYERSAGLGAEIFAEQNPEHEKRTTSR